MIQRLFPLFLVMVLAACSSTQDKDTSAPSATAQPPTATPALSLEARLQAEEDFEQLRQLHSQMQTVWEALQRGETAQCGEGYRSLSPESLPDGDPLNTRLRLAAAQLLEAVQLWQAECANPRQNVPSDIIDRGVLAVRGAGDALREVELLLNAD